MLAQLFTDVCKFVFDPWWNLRVLLAGKDPGLDELVEPGRERRTTHATELLPMSPYRAGPIVPTTQMSCIA